MTVLGSNLKTDFEGNFVFENIWPGRRRPCPGTNQCHSPSLSLSLLLSLPSLSLSLSSIYLHLSIYIYLFLFSLFLCLCIWHSISLFTYSWYTYLPTCVPIQSLSLSWCMYVRTYLHVRTYLFACTYLFPLLTSPLLWLSIRISFKPLHHCACHQCDQIKIAKCL